MKRYAYVYSIEQCNNKKNNILSIQATIKKYVETYFDSIDITTLTKEIAASYDVICVDHFAIKENLVSKDNILKYLNILKHCKNVCLLTRDLHEWTFSNDSSLLKEFSSPSELKIIYRPKNEIGLGYQNLRNIMNNYNIKYIVSLYDCDELVKIVNYVKCKSYVLSLHVDTNIYKNLGLNRDIDVLIYGADLYKVYPLRNKIKKVVREMKIKYHIIEPSPAYNPNTCNEGLANLLNRSWLTVCTASVFDYLVLKYFEASACGSVVIGNMPTQGKNIWENNYIDIPNDASDDQIKNIITNALSNKKMLEKIGNHMSRKIANEYNYETYALKLKNICENIIKNQ
ncbi:hypothetical protein QJ857_gp0889 [Tupanvirus soda lake]|uniref:Spore protein YkvP/CgeB glycosyl transferase-like domain-containing protein n=2 Tax=Tupanvirus TaxID=2094720 RepID=A0A6N1NUT0_9VIRU|nr:hypothetical protein QJ857_gp0889 [Tupanvirus soda lake]QKU35163.1 hypothetical protein [Tupanvirus soda lake]